MKYLNPIKYFIAVIAIVFIFFSWKIAIALFIISTLLHVFPMGPNALLSVIAGELIVAGIVFIFVINWKVGALLLFGGLLVTQFRIWGNRKNYEYYKKNKKR